MPTDASSQPILDAWANEPPPVRQADGTHAWDGMAPEREFADLAAALCRLLQPRVLVETGVGQGYVTRRLLAAVPAGCEYYAIEGDPVWRAALEADRHVPLTLIDSVLTIGMVRDADLLVVDSWVDEVDLYYDLPAKHPYVGSTFPNRAQELQAWGRYGKPGSVLLAHDRNIDPAGPTWSELIGPGAVGAELPTTRGCGLWRHL